MDLALANLLDFFTTGTVFFPPRQCGMRCAFVDDEPSAPACVPPELVTETVRSTITPRVAQAEVSRWASQSRCLSAQLRSAPDILRVGLNHAAADKSSRQNSTKAKVEHWLHVTDRLGDSPVRNGHAWRGG